METLQKLILLIAGAVAFHYTRFAWLKYRKKRGEKNAKNWLENLNTDHPIVKIYSMVDDAGKAINFYMFKNPLNLPAARAIAGEVAMRQAECNMDRETILAFIASMMEAAKKGEVVKMFADLQNMEERVNYACEEETLLSLACVYFLIEGEDPFKMNSKIQEKKKELIRSDENARAFFLTSAYNLTSEFSDMSAADILNYLKEQKQPKSPRSQAEQDTSFKKSASSLTKSTSKTSKSAGRALPKKKS